MPLEKALKQIIEHLHRDRERMIENFSRELMQLDGLVYGLKPGSDLPDKYQRELARVLRQLDSLLDLQAPQPSSLPVAPAAPDGENPAAPLVSPGEWSGFSIAHALRAYLARKRDGAHVKPEVVEVLLLAGVKLGTKPGREAQVVRISISMNAAIFKYDRKRDWVELIPQDD